MQDNSACETKLELRRYLLRKYHADKSATVLDCFQGSGLLWTQLRMEFQLAGYWGVDLKQKAGRLVIDSERLLAMRGWTADFVDLDAYGSPWGHWQAAVENSTENAITICTTHGRGAGSLGPVTKQLTRSAGIPDDWKLPNSFGAVFMEDAPAYAIATAERAGWTCVEAVEAFPQKSARYCGFRLEKNGCASNPHAA